MKKQTLVALAICALASSAFAQTPQGRPAGAPQVIQLGGPAGAPGQGAPGMQPPKELPFPEMKATVLKNITARLAEMTTVKACFEKAANKGAFDKCRPQRPQIQMQQGQPGAGGPQGKADFKSFMQQQRGQGVGAPPPGQAR